MEHTFDFSFSEGGRWIDVGISGTGTGSGTSCFLEGGLCIVWGITGTGGMAGGKPLCKETTVIKGYSAIFKCVLVRPEESQSTKSYHYKFFQVFFSFLKSGIWSARLLG